MDELIDIVSKSGDFTGRTALKSEAHKNGWYHNTIHLWMYTANEQILLQQRSHKKSIYPLLWDVSVAGHINAGESFSDAAIRETQEEIGLSLDQESLQKMGVYLHESIYNDGLIKDFEFHHVYLSELKVNLEQLHPDPNEVEALKLVDFKTFQNLLNHSEENSHFVTANANYYRDVLEAIKRSIA